MKQKPYCKNCESSLNGNFCYNCEQRTSIDKITFQDLLAYVKPFVLVMKPFEVSTTYCN